MTQRTNHPPEPSFMVCRLCGSIFGQASPIPFCNQNCAANWSYIMVPDKLDMVVCEQEPHPQTMPRSEFKLRQAEALLQEVWP